MNDALFMIESRSQQGLRFEAMIFAQTYRSASKAFSGTDFLEDRIRICPGMLLGAFSFTQEINRVAADDLGMDVFPDCRQGEQIQTREFAIHFHIDAALPFQTGEM